jgi:nucleoside-diphosphate-sugar epimerase
MSRVVITGGAGFIGTHLAAKLADNNDLVLVDNLRRDSLKDVPALQGHPRVSLHVGDVLDPAFLDTVMDGADAVVHMGAIAGVSSYYEQALRTLEVNVLGTVNVLDAAARHNVGQFVHFSSSEVFGSDALWVDEDDNTGIGPPSERRWVYATSKLVGEHFALRYGEDRGIRASVVRPFNIYGPRQTGEGAISNFCRAAVSGSHLTVHGDGTAIRAWCYVTDIVDAVNAILETEAAAGVIFNIGNPREVQTTLGLARRVVAAAERLGIGTPEIKYEPVTGAEVRARAPKIERARSILGFEPKVDLDEGLTRTLEWFKTVDAQ